MAATVSAIGPDQAMIEAYFPLSGRIRRLSYFGYSLLLVPIFILLVLLAIWALTDARFPVAAAILLSLLLAAFITWACLALGVKRCHDFNRSGWFYFWVVWLPGALSTTFSVHWGSVNYDFQLPVIGGIAGLVAFIGGLYVLFKRGTDGPNQYGYPAS
jgi:uncharacterized membrane protein YhaH (DUF805 family)